MTTPVVSSTDVQAFVDEIADRIGPSWREARWPIPQMIDMLNSAAGALDTLEQARRSQAQRKAANEMAEELFLPALRAKGL